jgi:hypothetical protein
MEQDNTTKPNDPEPIKDTDDAIVAADDAGNVKGGFNPQPDPPGNIRAFNPQPEPPIFRAPIKNF